MKRVIRHRITHAFLTNDGQWSTDYAAAKLFADAKAVCDEFESRDLKEVEGLLVPEENPSEFYKPIVPLPALDPTTGKPWLPTQSP